MTRSLPMRHLRLAPLALAAVLIPAALIHAKDPAPDPRAEEKRAQEMLRRTETLYRSLKVAPMTLNQKSFRQGEVVVVTAAITNTSRQDLPCPVFGGLAGEDGQPREAPVLGIEQWKFRRVGGTFGSTRHNGEVHEMTVIKAGQSVPLRCPSMRLDIAEERLTAGEWELAVHFNCDSLLGLLLHRDNFSGPSLVQSVRFTVLDNPAPSKPAGPGFVVGALTLGSDNVRKGAVVVASCRLDGLPAAADPARAGLAKHTLQWSLVDPSAARATMTLGEPMKMEAVLGSAKNGSAALSKTLATRLLEPGTHEVVLTLANERGVVVETRKSSFRVR